MVVILDATTHAAHVATPAAVLLHAHPAPVVAVHAIVLLHPHVLRAIRTTTLALRTVLSAAFARRPLVSVITPTWRRHRELLTRCLPSVRAQTYPGPVEHIIISDGPDPALAGVPGIVFLPAHRSTPNRGLLPRLTGTQLARGEIIAYLDDDNAWRPDHLMLLTDALFTSGAAFAYSRALCRTDDGLAWAIGEPVPAYGQIDTSLIVHRRALLDIATWQPSSRPADWDLTQRWLRAGASWAYVPRITLDYYVRSGVTV